MEIGNAAHNNEASSIFHHTLEFREGILLIFIFKLLKLYQIQNVSQLYKSLLLELLCVKFKPGLKCLRNKDTKVRLQDRRMDRCLTSDPCKISYRAQSTSNTGKSPNV